MTERPDGPPGDGGTTPTPPSVHDDASDVTPPRGKKMISKDELLIEKTIKFRFPAIQTHDKVSPASIHLHWIQTVQEVLGHEIQVINNKNRIIPKVDTLRWSSDEHHQHFNVHQAISFANSQNNSNNSDGKRKPVTNRGNTAYIVHRIRTSATIREIKSIPKVRELLRRNKVYLTMHNWSEDIWNTTHLGFIMGVDPQFLDDVNAKTRISNDIKNALPRAKVPRFELVFTTPSISINNQTVQTKAFAIETERSTSTELMKILKLAYKDTKAFVPFQMKQKNPEAYQRIVLQNSKLMAGNHIIVLNNIGPDVMYYLKDHILAIKGIKDVAPAPSYIKDGKYRVQVQKTEFQSARKTLMKELPSLYETEVPPDGKATTSKYNGPPEVATIFSDGYSSSSDGSYMSASIATAMSYDPLTINTQYAMYQNEVEEEKFSNSFDTPMSWADILKKKLNLPTHINVEDSSDNVSKVQQETSRLSSALEASQAEVELLKSRLAQMEQERNEEKKEIQAQVKEQVALALKDHIPKDPTPSGITTSQFADFVAMQDRRFQDMFTMFNHVLSQTNHNDMVSTSKRPAIIDLSNTSTGDNTTITSQSSDPTTEARKRLDRKKTPHKDDKSNSKEDGPQTTIETEEGIQHGEVETPNYPRIRAHQTTPTSMWYSPTIPPSPNLADVIMQDDVANPPTDSKEMAEAHYSDVLEVQNEMFREHLDSLTPIQLEDILQQHSPSGPTEQAHQTNSADPQLNECTENPTTAPNQKDKNWHKDRTMSETHANNNDTTC
ncbi:hypothetical protein MHU86_11328 [Fragilaria crotonensis]|nr:hypothetical protein MHU86_11328 [Fragilaria crotonensis]